MAVWEVHVRREVARYEEGGGRLGESADDPRQRQLTRMGNAAAGAGLALLMLGRDGEAADWLDLAAERYRESFADAPPGSWGRPIGVLKARILAHGPRAAADDAEWALATGAAAAESPIGRYAATLALLVLGRDAEALDLARSLDGADGFPADVAAALAAVATRDAAAYEQAVASVLRSFETRDAYLEDVPVADTVLVVQALARERGIVLGLESALLP